MVPGYPDITVGGCVALDVHGKSQFHSGNFGDWVTSVELFHPAHGALRCSPGTHRDVFELTIGGFGLTGLITRVELRTTRLPGPALELETAPVSNLHAAVELMEARAAHVAALYSWHNLTQRGARFGSGVVFMERFVEGRIPPPAGRRWLPLERRSPIGLWTRATTPIVMGCYERLQQKRKPRVLGLRAGFFPIAGLESYYAAFGTRGLREYQLIVPRQRWSDFVTALEPVLSRSRVAVTLASLKLFKGTGKFLRFRGAGICLALDVPANARALDLFTELDRMALEYGACVNIGKDSRIEASACRALFADYESYKAQLQAFDPARRCRSRLRERIDV